MFPSGGATLLETWKAFVLLILGVRKGVREEGRGERREGPQRGRGAKIVKGKPANALWGCWGQWS